MTVDNTPAVSDSSSTESTESPDLGYEAGVTEDVVEDIDVVEDEGDDKPERDGKAKAGLELDPDKKGSPTPVPKPKGEKKGTKLGGELLKALVTTKVDGEEEEITVEEAIRRAQKEKASTKRFQQAAQALKKIQEFEKMDPLELLKARGVDPMKLAHQLVSRQLEWEEMPEKDRQLLQYQEELKRYKAWEQQQQRLHQEQQRRHVEEQAARELDKSMIEGFKDAGLPKKKFYMQQMAAQMIGHLKRTGEVLSPKEAAAKVKKSFIADTRDVVDTLDAKAIREWLGEENVRKLLDDEVKRVTTGVAPTPKSSPRPGEAPAPKKSRPKAPLTEREWDSYMEEQLRKGG